MLQKPQNSTQLTYPLNSVPAVTTYPRNFAPTGPSSRILLASASPSMSGGGFESLSLRRYLQVTLMGMGALRGGTITRTPECLQPLIAPPLASTRKLTRKLMTSNINYAFIRWHLVVVILKPILIISTSKAVMLRANRNKRLIILVFYILCNQFEGKCGSNLCTVSDLNELVFMSVTIIPQWWSCARSFILVTHKYLHRCKKLFFKMF